MGIILLFFGTILGYLGYKLRYTSPKYNFEKTTSGRTIKFLDYSESKKHQRNKTLGTLMILFGVFTIGIGLLVKFFFAK